MLKNYTPAEYRAEVAYELVFDDEYDNDNGFSFPCDKDGCLLENEEQNPAAHENYRYCMARHLGACEWPTCGQWYNLFGQKLLPPDRWEEDFGEEEYQL